MRNIIHAFRNREDTLTNRVIETSFVVLCTILFIRNAFEITNFLFGWLVAAWPKL